MTRGYSHDFMAPFFFLALARVDRARKLTYTLEAERLEEPRRESMCGDLSTSLAWPVKVRQFSIRGVGGR